MHMITPQWPCNDSIISITDPMFFFWIKVKEGERCSRGSFLSIQQKICLLGNEKGVCSKAAILPFCRVCSHSCSSCYQTLLGFLGFVLIHALTMTLHLDMHPILTTTLQYIQVLGMSPLSNKKKTHTHTH